MDCRRTAITEAGADYYSCDFVSIAKAYGIRSVKVKEIEELDRYKNELMMLNHF